MSSQPTARPLECSCWRIPEGRGGKTSIHDLRTAKQTFVEYDLGPSSMFLVGTVLGAWWGGPTQLRQPYLVIADDRVKMAIPRSRIITAMRQIHPGDAYLRLETTTRRNEEEPLPRAVVLTDYYAHDDILAPDDFLDWETVTAFNGTPITEHVCMPAPVVGSGTQPHSDS